MKKYFKIFLWVLLAVAVIGTFMFLWQKSKAKPKEYQIETVTKQDTIENKTVITGTVEPRDEVLIKPQMNGIVAELLHEAGDVVQSGDVIARLTVVPEMIQLSQAESRVRMAEISYEQGKESYARSKDLFDKSVIALEEFEAAEANFAKIKEELSNAREAMEIVKKGASSRTAKQSNTLVRSTITGKILNVPVKVGNSVIQANTFNEGTTIASIADMNDLIFVGKRDGSRSHSTGLSHAHFGGSIGERKFSCHSRIPCAQGKYRERSCTVRSESFGTYSKRQSNPCRL